MYIENIFINRKPQKLNSKQIASYLGTVDSTQSEKLIGEVRGGCLDSKPDTEVNNIKYNENTIKSNNSENNLNSNNSKNKYDDGINTVNDKHLASNTGSDNNFLIELETYILSLVGDISANNMMEIMARKENTLEAITHVISVKANSEPIKQKSRGIPHAFRDEFKKTLEEMKTAGMIIDSKSPWCSPVRLVKKPGGSIRVCVDFRKVNNVTIKDSFPIPKIEDIFSHLAKAKIFSTIDLASGYYQIKMDKNSMQYTAFASQWGFYEYVVMPMGLTNACATFQRLMNTVLEGYIGVFCLVYLDDIIIYSENEQEHLRHVKLIIERLRLHNLKIKLSKCKFARKKVE